MAESMKPDSLLLPSLREGVAVVQMIFYKAMRDRLAAKYPDRDAEFAKRLAGAVLNVLFGQRPAEGPLADFIRDNEALVADEMRCIPAEFPKLCIPLTDALRVQYMCDRIEGVDTGTMLVEAKEAGVLIEDREIPIPPRFMHLVRTLGQAYGLVVPIQVPEADDADGATRH